jgi:cytoskeleton protein RodZ
MDETVATAPPPPPPPRTIGARLRAGRERAGISVAAAAEKLHLDPKVIDALEADRFAELGASVYVRGHLRRYADFVGEAGAELVEAYTAREARPPPPDLTQIPHAERRADPRRLLTPLAGLAGAAVLALAIWWILAGSKGGTEAAAATAPVAASPAGAPTAAAAQTPTMVAPARAAVPAVAARSSAAPAAGTANDPNATARRDDSASARETRLQLELANDSWVEVYDSRGERLFYDVASAGSVQSVRGRGPLRVVLGNAAGVTIEVDGQGREIPASALDGEGARFVINRSGSLARAR